MLLNFLKLIFKDISALVLQWANSSRIPVIKSQDKIRRGSQNIEANYQWNRSIILINLGTTQS